MRITVWMTMAWATGVFLLGPVAATAASAPPDFSGVYYPVSPPPAEGTQVARAPGEPLPPPRDRHPCPTVQEAARRTCRH